ncbi:MAG TPA: nitrous oxide reductase accessory protein NosL [Geobacteraceae bacterium]
MRLLRYLLIAATLAMLVGTAAAGTRKPAKPAAGDKCPVCGMFVAKYPGFLAQVLYRDGSQVSFDGAKDMFKYLLNHKKYAGGKQESQLDAFFVTDYYSLAPIDAASAWYVIGSDVFGPMGKELIAFSKEADAGEFKSDHKGKKILRFKDVTQAVLATLE